MSEWFIAGLAISVGLVAIVAVAAYVKGWAACLVAAAAIFLSCGAFAMTLALQGLMTLVWSSVCAALGWKARAHFAGAAVASAIAMAFAAQAGLAVSQRTQELRDAFPMQSLAARLEYETRPDRPPAALVAADSSHRSSVESSLAVVEERQYTYRVQALESLHAQSREEFMGAMGFGFSRMGYLSPYRLEFLESEPERLECPADPPSESNHDETGSPVEPLLPPAPEFTDLHASHLQGVTSFFDRDLMGYVAGKQQAAGFESHRLVRVPPLRTSTWQVVRLELVSLLKYDRPMVYSSAELPRMDALDAMPRRELVQFETGALDRLRQGEDVVFETAGNQIQMLGSLRAAKDCLDCHTAQRGELLGALSYELLPATIAGADEPR